jgi:hypothetical protein
MTATAEKVIEIKAGDCRFLKKGAELAKNASKNAVRLCAGLKLEKGQKEAEALGVDADAIAGMIEAREDPNLSVFLPMGLVAAAAVGVGLEVGAVKKARESAQTALVDDVKSINKTGSQLDRLLKELGGEPLFDLDD